jgi:glycosyltransferase involved in cell wall biosynthesis
MWKPTVSVVMCTYNGAAFIQDQLDSILAQTYPINELLIFDDGSTDGTTSIISEYCKKHAVIRFSQNPVNIGYNQNFEQAMKAASSEVIAIADQDDYWHSEKIARMIAAWKENTLLIYCDSYRFNGNIPMNAVPNPIYRRFEGADARKLFLYNTISGHAMLIKRRLLDISLPFKEKTIYDWWMGIVAACNGGVSYVPESLVYQRVHKKNSTINIEKTRSRQEARLFYKRMVHDHLQYFSAVPNMPIKYQEFAVKFYQLWNCSLNQSFYWPLFFFLMKNRSILFWYKKRRIAIISHMKHSFLLIKNKQIY